MILSDNTRNVPVLIHRCKAWYGETLCGANEFIQRIGPLDLAAFLFIWACFNKRNVDHDETGSKVALAEGKKGGGEGLVEGSIKPLGVSPWLDMQVGGQ